VNVNKAENNHLVNLNRKNKELDTKC